MEALIAAAESVGVVLAGLLVRLSVPALVLLVIAVPVLLVFTGIRGWGTLRRMVSGLARVDGLLWNPRLHYAPGHTWIDRRRSMIRVGLDDLAQRILAGARNVELPRPGVEVREGDEIGVVTCGNKRAAIASPIDGIVTAVNRELGRDPSIVNRDPYTRGWLFTVTPTSSRYRRHPRGEPARRWLGTEAARLTEFFEHHLGVAAADGGEFVFPAPRLLRDDQWTSLVRAFLGPGRDGTDRDAGAVRAGREKGSRMPRVLLPFAGVLAAVAGGLYVVFLPLIGLAYILVMAGARVWQGTRRGASWLINAGEAPQRGTGGRGGR